MQCFWQNIDKEGKLVKSAVCLQCSRALLWVKLTGDCSACLDRLTQVTI